MKKALALVLASTLSLTFGACEVPVEDDGTAADRSEAISKSKDEKGEEGGKPAGPVETLAGQLFDQLLYEGYTRKQAEYGVKQVGL